MAAVLCAIVLVAVGSWRYRESRRPVLKEVRVVTATAADPVFRDGARHLAPGEGFRLAVALRLFQPGRGEVWVSPARELVLGGRRVPHDVVARGWPERDRSIRVFWSTVECGFVGGEITPADAGRRMAYRTFLAPEYGRKPLVEGRMEAHNEDFLGQLPQPPEPVPGTLRFYARVEVYADPTDLKPVQSAASLGPRDLWNPALPVISRGLKAPAGIHPEVGELFLIPGMEPAGAGTAGWNAVTSAALGHTFLDLVRARLVASSRTFAAMAVTGKPDLDPRTLRRLGRIAIAPGPLRRGGRVLRWGRGIRPGDLLRNGDHWMVALADDGNGFLDVNDIVIHCWKAPAQEVKLIDAIDIGVTEVEQLRHAGR